jgi:ELWxxDGT repeat protein
LSFAGREETQATGEVHAAKQVPPRPGLAPALGLRAGSDGFLNGPQTASEKETTTMRFFSWLRNSKQGLATRRPANRRRTRSAPRVEELERRDVPSAAFVANIIAGATNYYGSINTAADVNGTLFFSANDNVHGYELWKSDGTPTGTTLVKDIYPGLFPGLFPVDSNPADLVNVNGTLFFTAYEDVHGRTLWKSDGTESGTVMVNDLVDNGIHPSVISQLTAFNSRLVFATYGLSGSQLWTSDGTEAGTIVFKGFPNTNNPINNLTNVNGRLFFTAGDGVSGMALWETDGTGAGTVVVKDLLPARLTNVNGTLFFFGDDGIHGQELWKSDGTTAGTVLVKDIVPGIGSSYYPHDMVNVNGAAYFTYGDNNGGWDLWKSDGTENGTMLVKTVVQASYADAPHELTNVNGTLYFRASGQLWKSDGTAAGTVPVHASDSFVGGLRDVNGRLFFMDLGSSEGLWTSDGTAAGTVRVQPWAFFPGGAEVVSNGSLFYNADDGTHYGLWRFSQFARNDTAVTATDTPVAINVLANDFVAAGSQPTVSVGQPAHGSAVANADGTVTYTPAAGFNGVDSFSYTVTNRFGDTDTATVAVTVYRPVQIDIGPTSINLGKNGDIAITVFSSATFDATTIDVASVRFIGAQVVQSSLEDVNKDGKLDLVLHLNVADTNLVALYRQLLLADDADGTLDSTRQQASLLLSGLTTSGLIWGGLDSVTLFESGQALTDLLASLGLK